MGIDNFNSVIQFHRREANLEPMSEMWVPETFEHRKHDVFEEIKSKRGCYPSKNMIAFKEGVFHVSKKTTLNDLKLLAAELKKYYAIDCFQATIDRSTNTAHMLFDWYGRKEEKPFYFNHSNYIYMSVHLLDFLNLPCPPEVQNWQHYFIVEKHKENPHVFEDFLAKLERNKTDADSLKLARHMIAYIENMCEGREK